MELQHFNSEENLKLFARQPAFSMPEDENNYGCDGLSRHEYLSALILQGLLAKHSTSVGCPINDRLVDEAVRLAGLLIDRAH